MTRPWSHVGDECFLELVETIRNADVSLTNLETVIHEFNGYAQAHCGGTYMASPPQIASELRWAGLDMIAHANNHSFDYGSTGVLETISHAENAGLVLAGSGRDLQNARAPRYLSRNGVVFALVAMAVDFTPYGKASYTRFDMAGRPGLNTLAVSGGKGLTRRLTKKFRKSLARIGLRISVGNPNGGFQVDAADLAGNPNAISEAASKADIVVTSVHAHRQGPWLSHFAHQAIERGANLVFIHGPHEIRGIELFNRRPIFYSMSDFVFEAEYVARFPAEAYERRGLPPDTILDDATRARLASPVLQEREAFEAFAALVHFAGTQVSRIDLIPVDLDFDGARARGRPHPASVDLGREIISRVATRSKRFDTRIAYDACSNRGRVILE
jgi:poly-gamma-glutamate synthesis protein (capsule biosynthesis protein)